MYHWIKIPYTLLEDFDFQSLTPAAAGMYLKLYLFAAKQDAGGALVDNTGPLHINRLAWHLRTAPPELDGVINELLNAGFLVKRAGVLEIARFMEEQGPDIEKQAKNREQWRERQARRREKLKLPGLHLEQEQEGEQEKYRDTEEEVDIEVTGESPVTGNTAAAFFSFWYDYFGVKPNKSIQEGFTQAIAKHGEPLVKQAVNEAALSVTDGAPSWKYIQAILDRCEADGREPGAPKDNAKQARIPPKLNPYERSPVKLPDGIVKAV